MPDPVKIAHVAYDLQIGGVTNILNQLLRNKVPGYEQILILLCGEKSGNENIPGVKTYRLNYKPSNKYSLPALITEAIMPGRYFKEIAGNIFQIYQEEKFNILHFHILPRDLGIGSFFLKQQDAVKLVCTDHLLRISKDEHNRLQGKILKQLYRRLCKRYNTVFVSKQAFEWAKEIRMINEKMLNTYIENSVEIIRFKKKGDYRIENGISIVYVTRITAVKGHFLLIAVTKILIEKFGLANFNFVLIGPGELTEVLKEEIRKNGLEDYFILEGSRDDVESLLPSYDLAVFPSEREGLPVALLEKMAAGLPVLASDIAEIRNVIQNTDEALLFPINNADACAEQLYRLIHDQVLRESIGNAARKAVEERYSRPLLEKYIKFYKDVLKS